MNLVPVVPSLWGRVSTLSKEINLGSRERRRRERDFTNVL